MTHYLAITIGPIYDTLQLARTTRQLWGASYLLSVLMREITKATPPGWTLLSPIIDAARPRHGAGMYPDRCFWQLDQEPFEKEVNEVIGQALKNTATLIGKKADDLAGLTRIAAVKLRDADLHGESAVLLLNRHLDAMELRPVMPTNNEKIVDWVEDAISKLQKDGGQKSPPFVAFQNGNHEQYRIPSVTEIALQELKKEAAYKTFIEEPINESVIDFQRGGKQEADREQRKEKAKTEEELYFEFKKAAKAVFRFRHKYVCFVIADGDSVGATLGAIANKPAILEEFSQKLGAFSQVAVDKIAQWGGLPIYAGGDDLLFVAPVQNDKQAHILNLVQELEELFPGSELAKLGKQANPNFDKIPALSFGLSIGYHKYPMFESIEKMTDLLKQDAKGHPGKNALAFRVLKHSGQAFGTTVGLGSTVFSQSLALLTACGDEKIETSFLTSVMHKLQSLQILLAAAAKNDMLDAFFKHHFNEPDHARTGEDAYITAVKELCKAAHTEGADVVETLFPILRFIQFVNQKDHE